MHDPMVVAFEIRRPWPQRRKGKKVSEKRWKIGSSPFWNIAGVELYWPGLITIWHVDPSGHDAFHDCPHSSKWQWHIHHWKLQVHPVQHLRRWALTRCEWCKGKSRKGDMVNCSLDWHRSKSPWWHGERGLYHSDCSAISRAHRQCVCEVGVGGPWDSELAGYAYGNCARCGKVRGWQSEDRRDNPRDAANRILQTIPHGGRDGGKTREVERLWSSYRRLAEAADLQRMLDLER